MALLVSGFDELKDAFEVSVTGGQSPSLVVFRHAGQYRDIYKAMASKRGARS